MTRISIAGRKARAGHSQFAAVAFAVTLLSACAAPTHIEMMPTPILYENSAVDPFAALPTAQQTTTMEVFYATGRAASGSGSDTRYGNDVDTRIHFGSAAVSFGEGQLDWNALRGASVSSQRMQPVTITLAGVQPVAAMDKVAVPENPDAGQLTAQPKYHSGLQPYLDAINAQLAQSREKTLMIYVHGTKVDFLNAVALTAEIDHFTGRDYVTLAYDWPSHQNILDYVVGVDKERAINASYQLKNTLILLAEHTDASRINILCYSAGCRTMSRALQQLRLENAELDAAMLQTRYRIGTAVFAAADVEVDRFLDRLPDIAALADQTVVTLSDADNVLDNARKVMGGAERVGSMAAEESEKRFITDHRLQDVYIVDVSRHKETRGFDIGGHHYWYRHPWMSSDILFLLRSSLPPDRRALTASEDSGIWYFASDYPDAVHRAAQRELASDPTISLGPIPSDK
jgi:esterase/lipase superfamily enzyme